jgi:hypothetical protein
VDTFDFDLDVATILFKPIDVVLGLVFFEFETVFTFLIVLLVGVAPVFLETVFVSGLVLTMLLDDDDDDDNLLLAPAIFILYIHILCMGMVKCGYITSE